jgi:acetyltransferase-like isoleucine patch superfamily enzyme
MVLYSTYLKVRFNTRISHNSIINKKTILGQGCVLHSKVFAPNSNIGKGTYIGPNSYLHNARIGAFCSIAKNVEILTATHPIENFVSIHPAFYSLKKQSGLLYTDEQLFKETLFYDDNYSVIIGNDVWIGTNVLILGGVRIGDGAVIAAGSIVTKDVADFEVVGGIPAKNIKYRFTEKERIYLLKIKWWEKDDVWLKKNASLFNDIKQFISNFE